MPLFQVIVRKTTHRQTTVKVTCANKDEADIKAHRVADYRQSAEVVEGFSTRHILKLHDSDDPDYTEPGSDDRLFEYYSLNLDKGTISKPKVVDLHWLTGNEGDPEFYSTMQGAIEVLGIGESCYLNDSGDYHNILRRIDDRD